MLRPAATQLISKNDSYYSLVIGIAKRAREIANELDRKGETLEEKPVKTAVEEFAVGKFRIVEASEPDYDDIVEGTVPAQAEEAVEEAAEEAAEEGAEESAVPAEENNAEAEPVAETADGADNNITEE